MGEKKIADNRRVRHDYQVLERFEAGIELQGTEVKSLRAGQVNFRDSYAEVRNGQLYWISGHIAHYKQGNIWNHDEGRLRRLLMHKREIRRLGSQIDEKGLTLVPLRLYFKDGVAKMELGLCRGKQRGDKRAALREREQAREIDRAVKQVRRR